MGRLDHHIFHSLAPIVLLTAYIVGLLAFLAPTPILVDRVYLMHVSAPLSSIPLAPGRHYVVGAEASALPSISAARGMHSHTKRQPATMVPVGLQIQVGPLGACYTNITSGDKVCQTPSFTPMFSELYDDISMPPQVSDALTTQFPFSPTFIFISLCLIFIEFVFVTALAIGMHKPQGNLAFIARKQHRLVRLSLLIGLVALVLGLAATGALRIVIASDISAAQGIPGVEAEVGTGFAQLWAAYILQAVVTLLLLTEFFLTRPRKGKHVAPAPDKLAADLPLKA